MNALTTLIRTLGPARLGAIGLLTALVLGVAIFALVRASSEPLRPLFTDLEFDDSAAIVRELETRGVRHELRGEGSAILVPADQVLSLRMALAESGLPAGGIVGYEIFDSGDGLGATSFVQNLNHLRALEGELSRTIRAIDRIRFARVHLVLPERRLFERAQAEPSASIVLKLRGALMDGQIRAIQHLVASAVKDLKPSRVSIVNDRGELLASGLGDRQEMMASTLDERRFNLESHLKQQVETIVASVVGPGNVRVQVTAELDTSRVTDTRDIFDPEGRVVRSSQTREEASSAVGSAATGGVSASTELPGADAVPAGGDGSRETGSTIEETVNYEISKQTTTEIREAGGVRRLSVAVLVDGLYSEGPDNTALYEPRPPEQIEQITTLVRSAIGFSSERGDTVEVINLRFAPEAGVEPFDETGMISGMTTADYLRIVELALLALVGLILVIFVVRPLVRQVLSGEPGSYERLALPAGDGVEGPGGPGGQALPAGGGSERALPPPVPSSRVKVDEVIDVARLTGQVQENSIRKVAELVKGNPEETVAIMRQWLQQGAT